MHDPYNCNFSSPCTSNVFEPKFSSVYMHRLGASIVTRTDGTASFLMKNLNQLCFIQYYNDSVPPAEWKEVFYWHQQWLIIYNVLTQVSLHFESNRAIIGSAIYADRLDLCSWNSYYAPLYDDMRAILHWPFITYGWAFLLEMIVELKAIVGMKMIWTLILDIIAKIPQINRLCKHQQFILLLIPIMLGYTYIKFIILCIVC